MSGQKFRILCVGDSRLAHLQNLLNNNHRNLTFFCFVFPGATLGRLAYELRIILSLTKDKYYDYIAIFGGICDLTVFHKRPNRSIGLAYTSVEQLTVNFERLFSLCNATVRLFTDMPIFYATIYGIHLERYASVDESIVSGAYQQGELNTAVPLMNSMIKSSNAWRGLPTLDVASFIHHSKGHGGTYRTKYGKLHDGCHPDDPTCLLMAAEILKKFTNFIYVE